MKRLIFAAFVLALAPSAASAQADGCVRVEDLICAPTPAASLAASIGQVQVIRGASASQARPQTGLIGGDRVQVGQSSSAILALSNACRVDLPSQSLTTIIRRDNLLCVGGSGFNPVYYMVGGGLLMLGVLAATDDGGSRPLPVSP